MLFLVLRVPFLAVLIWSSGEILVTTATATATATITVTDPIEYKFGIILPKGASAEICDQDSMKPVIDQAIADARSDKSINVNFVYTPESSSFYELSGTNQVCHPIKVLEVVSSAVALLAPEAKEDVPVPPGTFPNMVGRMILGPACSYGLSAAALLAISDSKPAMLLTGQAEKIHSIRDAGWTIRSSYSIYNMW
jgi:hypothetical protein